MPSRVSWAAGKEAIIVVDLRKAARATGKTADVTVDVVEVIVDVLP